jgi:uncharacterized membrane protein YkvA (DUF1232 family)
MPYKLIIKLSDRDLRHFRRELHKAREAVGIAEDEEILGAAGELVQAMRGSELPDFVRERLEKLENAIAMLTDSDWLLDAGERSPMLGALAYLCDPEDIIPDDIPGIGLLDDAVMIELAFRELHHEIEAYEDFRKYRKALPRLLGRKAAPELRARKLASRRDQLLARMRRRRAAERKQPTSPAK